MKRSHGKYAGRGRNLTSKGRMPPSRRLAGFSAGEKVRIDVNPAFRDGMPHLRFNKKAGVVVGAQGKAVVVRVRDIGKEKTLVVSNVHLAKT